MSKDRGEGVRTRAGLRLIDYVDVVRCCAFIILIVLVRAVLTLPSNLWLDETGTFWAANGGLHELAARGAIFPLSILYAAMIAALRSLGVHSPIILRLPSFVAIIVAAALVFRMAFRWWGRTAAWLAAAMFVSLPAIAFAACDMRPYALGVMFGVLSTWLLARFLDRPGYASAIAYALAAALSVHFHLLFGAAVIGHALYLGFGFRRNERTPVRYVLAAAASLVVFLLPVLPLALSVARSPGAHNFAAAPEVGELESALLPMAAAVCLLGGLAYTLIVAPRIEWNLARNSNNLVLAALVGFVPVLVLFFLSRISNSDLFVARYRLCAMAGLALCFGALASAIRPATVVRFMVLMLALSEIYWSAHRAAFHHDNGLGDWGAAMAFVDQNTAVDHAPVLMRSQFIESDALPLSPMADNPVFAQLTYYPSSSRLAGVNLSFGAAQRRNVENFLSHLGGARRFLLVYSEVPSPAGPLVGYIGGRLGPEAHVRQVGSFEGIDVIEFALP